MAYDRYVAICKPLHYLTVMDWKFCSILLVFCWLGGFVHTLVQTMLTVPLPSCGPNLIDHCFVTSTLYWSWLAQTRMCWGSLCWPTVAWLHWAPLSFLSVLTLSSCFLSRPAHQRGGTRPCPHVLPVSLLPSCFSSLPLHVPETFHHFPWEQDSGCILHHHHTQVEPFDLHPEKHGCGKCHDETVDQKVVWQK